MTKEMEKNGLMGERLLKLRNQKGLTQEGLAERLDVSRQSISKWELNKTLPDVDKLIQLSEMYQVSIDYLVTGREAEGGKEKQEVNSVGDVDYGVMHVAGTDRDALTNGADNTGMGETGFILKSIVLIICMLISGILVVCMAFLSGEVLLSRVVDQEDKKKDVVCVEKIHEQYTKADVTDDDMQRRTLWLDIQGVREGDFIFSYTDEENPKQLYFEYYARTLILPIIFVIVFLIFFIVFLTEWCMVIKRRRAGSISGDRKGN